MAASSSVRNRFRALLRQTPVIPGVKGLRDVRMALTGGARILFFVAGGIFALRDAVRFTKEKEALLLAHVDLLSGIGRDAEGMRFLAQEIGVDGILTTRSVLIKAAAKEGLLTVQRVFAVDSGALKNGLQVVRTTQPDALELLPAPVVLTISHRLPFSELPPVIAGGLLETPEEVDSVLKTSVVAVSASDPALWQKRRR